MGDGLKTGQLFKVIVVCLCAKQCQCYMFYHPLVVTPTAHTLTTPTAHTLTTPTAHTLTTSTAHPDHTHCTHTPLHTRVS